MIEALKTFIVIIIVAGVGVFIRGTLQSWKKKEIIIIFIVIVIIGFAVLFFDIPIKHNVELS